MVWLGKQRPEASSPLSLEIAPLPKTSLRFKGAPNPSLPLCLPACLLAATCPPPPPPDCAAPILAEKLVSLIP